MKKNENWDSSEIKNLIKKEEEKALESFQKSSFRSRIASRIESEPPKKPFLAVRLKKTGAVFALGLLILASGIALLIVFAPSPQKDKADAFEKFFEQAPNIQRMAKNHALEKAPPIDRREKSMLRENIQNVLTAIAGQQSTEKKKGADLFWEKNLPTFDLEQKIEILINQQKVREFLERYSKKSEEV